jgi:eukaryotic-like serine/threonine-protein kinase
MSIVPENDGHRKFILQDIQECERLIALDEKLAIVLKNDVQPANAIEWIQLAQFCKHYREQYVGAARYYAEAFEIQPDFTKDPRSGHRYNAACAAALAGCGQGKDADKLDTKDHIRLRNQARAWLRADLEAWAKLVEQGKADDRANAVKTLQHWQTDPDLAGLRDPAPLAKLPEPEQEACRKLWADVAALLKKVQESNK